MLKYLAVTVLLPKTFSVRVFPLMKVAKLANFALEFVRLVL